MAVRLEIWSPVKAAICDVESAASWGRLSARSCILVRPRSWVVVSSAICVVDSAESSDEVNAAMVGRGLRDTLLPTSRTRTGVTDADGTRVSDAVYSNVAKPGKAVITLAQEVRRGDDVLVKAQVRVAFVSEGRAQPIPKALRTLMKADLV